MISVNQLSYSYGKINALKEVSFNIDKGEIISIIGANGAGKSTLMKCIAGILKYQQGDISLNGETLSKFPHKIVESGISLVPEGRWIFPHLSVEDNLMIGGYTSKNRKVNIEKIYTLFPRLKERRTQRAGTMSGGEQQMLAIGRALMAEPSLIMLDEPSLGLAPLIVNDVFNIIQRINQEGVTVLLVEQNAKKALSIAHRGYVLETGKVIKSGTGKELANDPDIIDAYLGGKRKRNKIEAQIEI